MNPERLSQIEKKARLPLRVAAASVLTAGVVNLASYEPPVTANTPIPKEEKVLLVPISDRSGEKTFSEGEITSAVSEIQMSYRYWNINTFGRFEQVERIDAITDTLKIGSSLCDSFSAEPVNRLVKERGVQIDNYSTIIQWYYPTEGCYPFNGAASIDENKLKRIYIIAARMWGGIVAHETGHLFGFGHAGNLFCFEGARVFLADACGLNEYGLDEGVMGHYSSAYRGINKLQLFKRGLLESSQSVTVTEKSETHTISCAIANDNKLKLLFIPSQTVDNYYTVSCQDHRWAAATGAFIHIGGQGRKYRYGLADSLLWTVDHGRGQFESAVEAGRERFLPDALDTQGLHLRVLTAKEQEITVTLTKEKIRNRAFAPIINN